LTLKSYIQFSASYFQDRCLSFTKWNVLKGFSDRDIFAFFFGESEFNNVR
jgi:hypothetical protein